MAEGSKRRDATASQVLLDAVERLCETRSPSEVTMRNIAAEAGVSVGLAYHHFDSKVDLFGAALDRMATSLAEAAVGGVDSGDVVPALVETLKTRPAFPRMVAWFILTGRSPTQAMQGHPVIRETAATAGAHGHPDPVTVGALLALFGLSASFFGSVVNTAAGRDAADPRLVDALARAFHLEANRIGGE